MQAAVSGESGTAWYETRESTSKQTLSEHRVWKQTSDFSFYFYSIFSFSIKAKFSTLIIDFAHCDVDTCIFRTQQNCLCELFTYDNKVSVLSNLKIQIARKIVTITISQKL